MEAGQSELELSGVVVAEDDGECEPMAAVSAMAFDPLQQDPLADKHARLVAACLRAWPAMKFWGLCGASGVFVDAALEIGQLIGTVDPQASVNAAELLARGRVDGMAEACRVMRESEEVRVKLGRRMQGEAAEALRRELAAG